MLKTNSTATLKYVVYTNAIVIRNKFYQFITIFFTACTLIFNKNFFNTCTKKIKSEENNDDFGFVFLENEKLIIS